MDTEERDYRPCASQSREEFGEDGDRASMDTESEQEEKKTVARRNHPRQQQQDEAGMDTFQRETGKWEEFYDDMRAYLVDGSLPPKGQANILKQAEAFSLGPNSSLYYTKLLRDGIMQLKLPVVRNYEDRVRVCKAIHLNTGEEFIHHRRDTMLELLGQQFYWKGQRRDVCQCIASCEVCAVGLGGKRRAKPPSQKRDVRPSPQKLLRLATSPLSVPTSAPLPVPAVMPPSFLCQAGRDSGEGSTPNLSLSSDTTHTLTDSSTCTPSTVSTHLPPDQNLTRKTLSVNLHPDYSATGSAVPVAVDEPTSSNLFTVTTDERTSTCSTSLSVSSSRISAIPSKSQSETHAPHVSVTSDPVTVSENSGFQIFTTINEPYEHEEVEGGNAGTLSKHLLSLSSSVHDYPNVASEGSAAEEFIVQGDSASADATVEVASSAPSIYQLLFQLHSEPNTSLCTAVVESMHMSLQSTADPVHLAQAASKSLVTIFGLFDSTAALVCPSRAAAYVTALMAILLKQDPLSVNPQISRKTASPPTVLHDTCCQAGSPKLCSSLVGACNWNLGTPTTPMDRDMLQMAVASNRVTAVFHRPYIYPRKSSFLQLHTLSSVCHTREPASTVAVIVDCSNMPDSLVATKFTPTLREMLTRGADLIMLPDTEHFQGPPNTCVLIGGAALLGNMCQQLPLLQSQLGLPLLTTTYDTVGSVVAFKALQVSTLKTKT